MNRTAIIVLTTAGIFVVLGVLAVLFFEGWPPWPVIFWFAVSHIFFCCIVASVKPYRGPYTRPMAEPDLPRLE